MEKVGTVSRACPGLGGPDCGNPGLHTPEELRRCLSYKEVKEEVEKGGEDHYQCRSLMGYLQEYCGTGSLYGITTQWDL